MDPTGNDPGRRGAVAQKGKRPAPAAIASKDDAEVTISRPLARPPTVGDVVAEKYRLLRTLGRGGMGRIFAAEHLALDTTVALKFMHPHLAREPASVKRFAREARAAATLKSPYAARIIDVDQVPSGELYIVMEYLEGESLETVATKGRGMPTVEAVTYMLQACDALAEAHDRGIIHRDVKPANLFRTTGNTGEPIVKVLDFGLARSVEGDINLSREGQVVGTPQYMSPEQISGRRDLDGRTDVWSMGVTLYELLAGHPAYRASSASATFTQILYGTPTSLLKHRPDVPAAVVAVIERCMMRSASDRFANVRELAVALEASIDGAAQRALSSPAQAYAQTAVSPCHPFLPSPVASVPVLFDLRRTQPSYTPAPMTMSSSVELAPKSEPTVRQTMLAALAGPALIAVAAGVMAILLGTAHGSMAQSLTGRAAASTSASSASATTAKSAEHLTARAGSTALHGKTATVAVVSAKCARHPRSAACRALAQK